MGPSKRRIRLARSLHALSIIFCFALGCDSSTRVPIDSGTALSREAVAPTAEDDASTVENESGSYAQTQLSDDMPTVWSIGLDRQQVMPGETVTLTVSCEVHSDWHIYSVKGPTGVARPTRFELELPPSVTVDSDWDLPNDKMVVGFQGPESHYTGKNQFSVRLRVDENASPGSVRITCKVHYQACQGSSCLPPASELLTAPFSILSAKER